MNGRYGASRVTVGDILVRLGPDVLRPLTTSKHLLSQGVAGVAIYDKSSHELGLLSEILFAVGVDASANELLDLTEEAASLGLAALVIRSSTPVHPKAVYVAQEAGVALLAAAPSPWGHLASLVKSAIIGGSHCSDTPDLPALGDLFAFANHLAREFMAPVTIEDPDSNVTAYSTLDYSLDEPRTRTILGRAVPSALVAWLEEKGTLDDLHRDGQIVRLEAAPHLALDPRVAIGINAAGEHLGSIWIASKSWPIADATSDRLRAAARTAALHILHHRIEILSDQSGTDGALSRLLAGERPAYELAARAGLHLGEAYRLVVVEPVQGQPARQQLPRALAAHWLSVGRIAHTLGVERRVYSAIRAETTQRDIDAVIDALSYATKLTGVEYVAAIGPLAGNANELAPSRKDADRTLRMMLMGMFHERVAAYEVVQSRVTVLALVDHVDEHPELQSNRLHSILSPDATPDYLKTLNAFLNADGDVRAAASVLFVHPNTLRYRLRRIRELTGVDLRDPYERLIAFLEVARVTRTR